MIEKNFSILLKIPNISLESVLSIPNERSGLVLFAHGSGSNRISYRNQIVAKKLNEFGIGTLLFDLLTDEEQQSDSRTQKIMCKIPGIMLNKFNIHLLTERLLGVTDYVVDNPDTKNLNIGYFGSSTGAAAALIAASKNSDIKAIVTRSGRVDLVENIFVHDIIVPTMFIVGGNDKEIIEINKNMINKLTNIRYKKLEIITGASHLFEEQEKLIEAGVLASNWFRKFIT
ncbi:MAG TPA: dienelactone hydrolase family protein [Nitrososphaeraceae archaeon]